jgi:hypothetical protein
LAENNSEITLLGKKEPSPTIQPEPSNKPMLEESPASGYFDLKGSFLYWFSQQNGLGYTTKPESTFTTSDFSKGNLVHPHFDWEPGFRIDAAYKFKESHWTLGADYIWYHGKAHGSKSAEVTEGMFPALSFSDDTLPSDYIDKASMHWRLHANLFDVYAAYEWLCSSSFSITPSLGLRNVWLHQKAKADYSGGTFAAGTDTVHLKSRFYALGPRLAFKPQFFWGKCFSFYSEGGISVFGGWFNVHQNEEFLDVTRAKLHRKLTKVRWSLDATAGIVFSHDTSKNTQVSLDLGFDYMIFFRQNQFEHGSQYHLRSQGTALTLYGAHAALGLRF